ncbi:MAG: DUF2157 domain-containing protein [Leptolyngbya sp. SIO1D8]|nr:DUF2157 domain-containing protein [Leptolyngbya sp. SIO1D8]
MVSEKFRRQLRQETESWWREGLIDASFYEQLANRYQFSELEGAAKNRFVAILMGLGGILVGLGAITYVAANWQAWPREARVMLLLSVFIAVNAAGFYLWRRSPRRHGRHLGHGLLLLGGLLLGANLGLLSQMFHQSGNLYELYLVWSLGVLVMAYSLRLMSLGTMSIVLMAIAYYLGVETWYSGTASAWSILIEQMPLVGAFAFLPLAWFCRSRVLFALTTIGISGALNSQLALTIFETNTLVPLALVIGLSPTLLWVWGDALGGILARFSWPEGADFLRPVGRAQAVVNLCLILYVLTFHWLWMDSWLPEDSTLLVADSNLFSAGVLLLIAVIGGIQSLYHQRHRQGDRAVNNVTFAVAISLSVAIVVIHQFVPLSVVAPVVFNLMLFLLAFGLIRDGLALDNRWTFWGGILLLVLGILSRTLEYNTSLLLKAVVFMLCGISIILAGLWFERHLRSDGLQPPEKKLPAKS